MNNPRYGISNMVLPPEGPQAVRYVLDFVNNPTGMDLDLSDTVPDQMSFVQGMYIDNADSLVAVICTVTNGTQQRITIPAGSQCYVPILVDNPPNFHFVGKGGNPAIAIPVYFYNMPIPPLVLK